MPWALRNFQVPVVYMNREELILLADKILKKEASEADIKAYNAWYNSFQQTGDIPVLDEDEKKAVLFARISSHIQTPVRTLGAKQIQFTMWAGVAAAVATVVLGVYFFSAPISVNNKKDVLISKSEDIRPGRNTATLTLANGKSITLSAAKSGVIIDASGLKYDDQTAVTALQDVKSDVNQIITIATPRGGTYQVLLADGSKVWLNAASTLRFPASFERQDRRNVELVGEAYFEISKVKGQEFIVNTKNQRVEVLGTHFNVNGYLDEADVKTTLVEGSVRVSIPDTKLAKNIVLVPGQQSMVFSTSMKVKEVDVNDVIAWKEGKFIFVRENVKSIMKKISRWYNVEIVYEGDVSNKYLGGSVSRFKNVSEVLEKLSATKAVQFRIENNKVIVMPFKQ
jgi:transmembrane sensor